MNVVFHQAALGDFALILPLLRGLDGPTTLVTPWSRGRLAAALIDSVSAMDIEMFEFTRLYSETGPHTLGPLVADLFDAATTMISFVNDRDDFWAANVVRLAPRANVVCLATRPPADLEHECRGHVVDWHAQELMSHGITATDPGVAPTGDPAGPIVVHPGSGGREKCWPRERFEQLMDRLHAARRPVRVIYGEAEVSRWPRPVLDRWHTDYHAVGCGSLESLVEQMLGASRYLGNDAGPTHLAAQLGLPTTALFGPTDPAVWAPRGPSVEVIAPDSPMAMQWLDVDRVAESILG